MFLYVVMLLIIAGKSSALIGYNCEGEIINKTTISLVDVPECYQTKPNITVERVSVAVTQIASYSTVSYKRCSIILQHEVFRCGKSWDTIYPEGRYNEIVSLSREKCEKIIDRNEVPLPTMGGYYYYTIKGNGEYETTYTSWGELDNQGGCRAGPAYSTGTAYFDRPYRRTLAKMTFGEGESVLDYEESRLSFPNGMKCDYKKEKCDLVDYGFVFWREITPECVNDKKQQSLVFSGPADLITRYDKREKEQFVQVNYNGYDFQILLADKMTEVCHFKSHHTEHPKLFITILGDNVKNFPLTKKVDARDVDMMLYLNSKLVYSTRHIKDQVEKLFLDFQYDRCQTLNRITQNMLTLAVISPKEFAYQYFGGPGYTAVTMGEVVHIAKCPVVSVMPRSPKGVCHSEFPVTFKDEDWFLTPRTRVLVKTGTVVECAPGVSSIFSFGGKWRISSSEGLMASHEKPETIKYEALDFNFEPIDDIAVGGLYTQESLEKIRKVLMSPLEDAALESRVLRAMEGKTNLPEGFSISNGFSVVDLNVIEKTVETWYWKWFTRLSSLGSFASFILSCVLIFKAIIYVLSSMLNFRILNRKIGLLAAFLFCWWDSAAHHLLKGDIKTRFSEKREKDHNDIPLDDIKVEPNAPLLSSSISENGIYPKIRTDSN
nr:MAG: glycoprotein [Tolviot virus]